MPGSWPSSSFLPGRAGAPWPTWGVTLSTGVCLVAALGFAPLFGWALARERWIVIGLLALAASVPIFIRWPVVSTFGLYAFLVPLDSVATLSGAGGATLTRLVGLLAVAVLLVSGLVERRLARPPLAALWWSLFMVWAALSAAWAIDPDKALANLRTPLSLFIVYLIAVSFRPSRKELHGVCLLVIAGGLVAATAGYLFGVEEGARGAGARARLVMGAQASNPNSLGAALILPLALALAGFVGSRSKIQKLLALGTLGVLGLGVYASMSRGALLAILVTILVFAYRTGIRWQILVPVALLLALVTTMPDLFVARVSQVFSADATGAGRTVIWKVGLTALENFSVFVFGAGYSNYTEIYGFSDRFSPGVWNKGAHSTFLGTWVELGIVGLALMLAALASHLLDVRGIRRGAVVGIVLSAMEAGCVGMLAGAFFADRLGSKSFWLLWILLTWAIGSARESQETKST